MPAEEVWYTWVFFVFVSHFCSVAFLILQFYRWLGPLFNDAKISADLTMFQQDGMNYCCSM